MIFQSSLGPEAHEAVLQEVAKRGEDTPHYLVPTDILFDPVVLKAVQFLIGPTAVPDVCRHVHINSCSEDGLWHQDDYDGEPWPEGKWAILFYFPQPTPLEMGGTSILVDGQEVIATGPAGTCLLAPGDVMHRSRANTTGQSRVMIKYLFRADA